MSHSRGFPAINGLMAALGLLMSLPAVAEDPGPHPPAGVPQPETMIPAPPVGTPSNVPVAPTATQLTYDQAVSEGLKANLDLIAAQYSIPMAEADELTAGLWGNPVLQLDTTSQPFGSNWNGSTVGGPREYDLVLQIPIDVSGKRSTAVKSAHQATEIARFQFKDAIRQKVLQIRLAYVDVLTAQQQLGLFKSKEEDLNHLIDMLRNKIGKKTLLPLIQRRALLARDQARLDAENRQISLKAAKSTLSLLLARSAVDGGFEAVTKLRDFKIVKLPPVERLNSEALDLRPDLKSLKLAVTKSDRDIEAAHAQVWDDFTISVGAGLLAGQDANPNDPTSNPTPGSSNWQAALQIPLPIFNRNQGNIRKAVLTREQSDKQYLALALSIRQEIDSLYDQLVLNQHLIETYESSQLENARKVHDAEQTQFGTGNSALLDYFDAMGAYYDTLSSYYDAVGEYRRAVARLQASVGKDEF